MERPAKNPIATYKHALQPSKNLIVPTQNCKLLKKPPASESAVSKDFFF